MTTYRIDVYTGQATPGVAGATDANVFVTLYGNRASSEELRASNGAGRFGLTGRDSVIVQLCDLGDVGGSTCATTTPAWPPAGSSTGWWCATRTGGGSGPFRASAGWPATRTTAGSNG